MRTQLDHLLQTHRAAGSVEYELKDAQFARPVA
jgi:hypothetical protein